MEEQILKKEEKIKKTQNIAEYFREYRKINKDKINLTETCPFCKIKYIKRNHNQHITSKRHKLATLEDTIKKLKNNLEQIKKENLC